MKVMPAMTVAAMEKNPGVQPRSLACCEHRLVIDVLQQHHALAATISGLTESMTPA